MLDAVDSLKTSNPPTSTSASTTAFYCSGKGSNVESSGSAWDTRKAWLAGCTGGRNGCPRGSSQGGVASSQGRLSAFGGALLRKERECAIHVPAQRKRATRKPPPVCFSGHQNLCSTLNTTFERLLLPTRSITKRMFAELSPSSELPLSPISAPVPQF